MDNLEGNQLSSPPKPNLIAPKQKSIGVFGMQAVDVTTLDCNYLARKNVLMRRAEKILLRTGTRRAGEHVIP